MLDFAFLAGTASPTLAVLHADAVDGRHVSTYCVAASAGAPAGGSGPFAFGDDLRDGPWSAAGVEPGAGSLVALPRPACGVLVLGAAGVTYLDGAAPRGVASPPATPPLCCACRVDADGRRHVVADAGGGLHLLVALLAPGSGGVEGLSLTRIGHAHGCLPSSLVYLDSGVLFAGSAVSDGALLRMHSGREGGGGGRGDPPSLVDLVEPFPCMGPIVALAATGEPGEPGGGGGAPAALVAACGVGAAGSLRVIRAGVGFAEHAAAHLPGVRGLWALDGDDGGSGDGSEGGGARPPFLVVSFVGETRCLALTPADELEERPLPGFEEGAATLFACVACGGAALLQLTSRAAALVPRAGRAATWAPPPGAAVTAGACVGDLAVVALSGSALLCLRLDVSPGAAAVTRVAAAAPGSEVACVDARCAAPGGAPLAAVGLWSGAVQLRALPHLDLLWEAHCGGDAVPRSLLVAPFEGAPHLLVALSDGALLAHPLRDPLAAPLAGDPTPRRVPLGARPASLVAFASRGTFAAFATGDRPAVIHAQGHRLLVSSCGCGGVDHAARFSAPSFPDALALATPDALLLGSVDHVSRLHVRAVPLGEQPRRVAACGVSRTVAVAVAARAGGGGAAPPHALLLLDDVSFASLHRFELEGGEVATALACVSLAPPGSPPPPRAAYYALGTARVAEGEAEPSAGRVLLFSAEGRALSLVAARDTRGGVYALAALRGRLAAAVNARVGTFRLAGGGGCGGAGAGALPFDLASESTLPVGILALHLASCGDSLLVGDLMKSATLLALVGGGDDGGGGGGGGGDAPAGDAGGASPAAPDAPPPARLEEVGRDASPAWVTAANFVDADTLLVADAERNLLVLRRGGGGGGDDEAGALRCCASFHLGDQVNAACRATLAALGPADGPLAGAPQLLLGGVVGGVVLVARLPPDFASPLLRLQAAMADTVDGVGGLPWAPWRRVAGDRAGVADGSPRGAHQGDEAPASSHSRAARPPPGFIDGDLVEAFLDLPAERQERVATAAGVGRAELAAAVEECVRLH